jgi:pilus assembly protein CpaE
MPVITTSQVLLFCSDPKLGNELEVALTALGGTRPVVHQVNEFRQAIEAIRSRRPDLALIEMTGDMRLLKAFAEEVGVASPETSVVAVFRPDVFGPDVSESAILIEAIRAGVKDFLRRPISSFDVGQLLDRLFANRSAEPRTLGTIVSLISNKGGVGKSTLAVNAAAGLALRHPGRVLLVDASLQMGVCSCMLDLNPTTTITDAYRQQDRLDETLIRELATPHSTGLHVLAAPPNAVDGAEIDDQTMSRVLTLARRAYDFVVVDTFPMLDRVNMAVLDLSDRVYIVLENIVPTILSGVRLIELLDELNFDASRQRVVLNRYSSKAGNLKPIDVARRIGRSVNHVLPFHVRVQAAANTGMPYVRGVSRFSTVGRRIRGLIDEIDDLRRNRIMTVEDSPPVAPSRNGKSHQE